MSLADMPVKKGLMSPQNVFIETIIRKFDGSPERNFILGNAQFVDIPIVYSNEGFCRLTGYKRTELLQKPTNCDFLCGQGTDPVAVEAIGDALRTSDEKKVQLLLYKKNGTAFLCSLLVAPIKNENGVIVMYIVNLEDVTTSPDLTDVNIGEKVNAWELIRRRISKGALKLTSSDVMSENDPNNIELKESLMQPCISSTENGTCGGNHDKHLVVCRRSIEKEALIFDYKRRRATSCFEISPSMVEGLKKEDQRQDKADSLDNFFAKLNARKHNNVSAVNHKKTRQSMTSVQSFGKLTVNSRKQSLPELKPKKTEKFAQVLSLGTDVLPEYKTQTPPVHRWTILHYSPFKSIWDWFILVLVTYTAIVNPYMASFALAIEQEGKNLYSHPLTIVDYVVDFMFVVDIIINLRTTYVDLNGDFVSRPRRIAKHYIKTWFLIDVVAAIPFELLYMIANTQQTTTLFGLLKTARLLRLVRVVRKLDYYSEYGAAVLCLLMLAFALIAHWLACIWFAIGNIEHKNPSVKGWLDSLAEDTNQPYNGTHSNGPSQKSRYVTALYFTLSSLTSVGFGNVSPNTNAEKIFSICIMLIGSLFYAAVFGNVAAIIARLYSSTARFHEQMQKLREFIRFYQLPKHLRQRIEEYAHHQWSYTNGIEMNEVMQSLPDCLQADICVHMHRQLITEKKVFASATRGFLREFSVKLKTIHLPPGDYILFKGDDVDSLFFITRGTIEIVDDRELILAILGQGDTFGDDFHVDPLGAAKKTTGNIRALTYCDLREISRDDLINVLRKYPHFWETFRREFEVTYNLSCEHEQTRSRADSKTSIYDENYEMRNQKCGHIPIIIKTSPNGEATIPLLGLNADKHTARIETHNKLHREQRDTKNTSVDNGRNEQSGNIHGISVEVKRNDNLANKTLETRSCMEEMKEDMKNFSLRLKRLEDKIDSNVEGIREILKYFQDNITSSEIERNSSV